MTARRTDQQLADAIRQKGFTPGRRDLLPLLDLVASPDEDTAEAAERSLAALGADAARAAIARVEAARPPLRGRLTRLVGRVAGATGEAGLRDFLLARLDDADAKTRRNAIVALGRCAGPEVETALLACWERDSRVEHRRSLAASLGKVGGERARTLLRAVSTDDAELTRIAARAVLMLERAPHRAVPSGVDAEAVAPRPRALRVRCREGIEALCAAEFPAAWAPRVEGPGQVRVTLTGRLAGVFRSRTMLAFGFALPPEPLRAGDELPDAVARALVSPSAAEVFATWTRGPVRYRLAWEDGGHRRAAVWRCAALVSAADGRLVNDPQDATWEVAVREEGGAVHVELVPRRLDDPRFAWRRGDVPAASHPTLAAALARVAGARADDVVWDPFVGSGLELVERALLGPWKRLLGTDLDPKALDVARANLAAAGVRGAEVYPGDALGQHPPGVTLVITNPPMGNRVGFGEDVGALLERFVEHAARVLAPGGRLVWFSPVPARTAAAATRAGLAKRLGRRVDMGGFEAELQSWEKPARRRVR